MSNALSAISKKYWSDWEGGWYVPSKSHSHFLKFSSKKSPSISLGKFVIIEFGIIELMFRLPMTTLFPLLNRRLLIVNNGSKNSSLLISLENLVLMPQSATVPFVTLCIFKYSDLTRLSKPRPSSFLRIFFKEFNAISDPFWGDSLALKDYLND